MKKVKFKQEYCVPTKLGQWLCLGSGWMLMMAGAQMMGEEPNAFPRFKAPLEFSASSQLTPNRGEDYREIRVEREWKDGGGTVHRRHSGKYVEVGAQMPGGSEVVNPVIQIKPMEGGAGYSFQGREIRLSKNLQSKGSVSYQDGFGGVFRSHPLGIGLVDVKSGKGILLGSIQACEGEIVGDDSVVYSNAMEGLKVDLRYRVGKDWFEQDVILREQLPDPQSFGLNPDSTVVEVYTEFLKHPDLVSKRIQIENSSAQKGKGKDVQPKMRADWDLNFGRTRMAPGKAFQVSREANNPEKAKNDAALLKPIHREWRREGKRTILVESMSYADCHELLLLCEVPSTNPDSTIYSKQSVNLDTLGRWPESEDNVRTQMSFRESALAMGDMEEKGVVLDYLLVTSQNQFVFESGKTYRIQTPVTFSGGVVFQSGTVIKFGPLGSLRVMGTVTCPRTGTLPAILTAEWDHSVGERIVEGEREGERVERMLDLYANASSVQLSNLHIRHARQGIHFYAPNGSHRVQNVTFIECSVAVSSYFSSVTLDRVIFCDVDLIQENLGNGSILIQRKTELGGSEDLDGDGLSNRMELGRFFSDPARAYSKSSTVRDGEFFLTTGGNANQARLTLVSIQNGVALLRLNGALPEQEYEIYLASQVVAGEWILIHKGAADDGEGTGTREYRIPMAGLPSGFFTAWMAGDLDGDGLSDGYEVMVTRTTVGNPDGGTTRDLDGNGILDGEGFAGNGIRDGDEDFDGDGIPNNLEMLTGMNPLDGGDVNRDRDVDGLPDRLEWMLSGARSETSISVDGDEDGDGWTNGSEWVYGSNAADGADMGYVMRGYPMSGQFTIRKPAQAMPVNPFDGINDWLGGVFGDSFRNTFFGLVVIELENELLFQWNSTFEQDSLSSGSVGLKTVAPLAAANLQGYTAEDLIQVRKILASLTVLASESLANVNYEAVYGLTHKQMELAAKISTQRIRIAFQKIQLAAIYYHSEDLFQMTTKNQLGKIHTELTRLNATQKAYLAQGFADARIFMSAISRIFWVSTVVGNLPNWIQAMNDYAYSLAYEGEAEILLNLVNLAIYSEIIAPGSGNIILAWLL